MMANPSEHRAEAERLPDIVRQAADDDYQTAADQVPVLLAALVHATLGLMTRPHPRTSRTRSPAC